MKKKTIVTVLIVALAILCGAFWLKHKAVPNSKDGNIRIGVILPLTGKAAGVGNPAKEGLIFAQSYINDSILSNSNHKVEILIEDGEGMPAKSLSALNKLLTSDKCDIIFSIISPVDLSILPIQKKEEFLFISHASHPGLSGVGKLVFRHSQTVEQEFDLISEAIGNDWNNAAYIYTNDDYGVSFDNLVKGKNRQIEEYAINANDALNKSVVERIVQKMPKYIVLNGNAPALTPVITTLKEKGYHGDIYTCLGFAATGGMSQDLRGISMYCVNFNLSNEKHDVSQSYVDNYHKEFGTNQIIFFNSALLIGTAIKEGCLTPQSIAAYIENLNDFKGISEDLIINKNNDILPPITLIKTN